MREPGADDVVYSFWKKILNNSHSRDSRSMPYRGYVMGEKFLRKEQSKLREMGLPASLKGR